MSAPKGAGRSRRSAAARPGGAYPRASPATVGHDGSIIWGRLAAQGMQAGDVAGKPWFAQAVAAYQRALRPDP